MNINLHCQKQALQIWLKNENWMYGQLFLLS